MKAKSNTWHDLFKPIVVLFAICAVVAVLLSYVNTITEPIIEENTRIQAELTRKEVLPGASSFTEISCDKAALDITGAYKEDSGLGYVLTSSHKGYDGQVVVTVGLDNDGKIIGIRADVSTETQGVGSKAGDAAYLDKYLGLSGSAANADTISGATYSSTAVKAGVNAVLAAFEKIK